MSYSEQAEEGFHTQIGLNVDLFSRFRSALSKLQSETNLTKEEILKVLDKGPDDFLPVSVFSNRKLGILEIIVKYLVEEQGKSLAGIAKILKRDNRTIWSTYNQAKRKCPEHVVAAASEYLIPLSIFRERKLGVLEVLVTYLRDSFKLRYSQIGLILARDQRTIWTVYNRAKKK